MHKVLIAEDDKIFQKRLKKVFEKYEDKIEIIQVYDGQEAIEYLKTHTISLLVTDIQMPSANGLVVISYMNEYHPYVPCFVMTSYGTSRLKEKLSEDVISFYQKPFDPDEFADSVMEVLDRLKENKQTKSIPVIGFLEMIEMEKASCVFEIRLPGKPPGEMYFEKGELYDAVCGSLKGEEAALELIPGETATVKYRFFPRKIIQRKITTDLKTLIEKSFK